MAQIEAIQVFDKKGVNLYVYRLYPFDENLGNIVKAEITDIDDNILFSTNLYAKTYEEVAQELNLTLINEQ